jgi:molybdopterin/thiamine biosynthesis adenylyltransferase
VTPGPRSDRDAEEADRFARQRIIPGWDQPRLAASTVVVIGVGALGNEVVKNLALAGVGRLVLCDPDVVAESNLSRTVLFSPADVGTPKATAAAAALRRLSPDVGTDPRVADLVSGVGLGELADADLVIGCVDTIRARVQLLGRCALAGAPLLDGGTSPWGAELRIRLSPDEPCFGCTLTPHQRSVSDLPWSCAEPLPDEQPQAAAIATTAVAAGWLCSVAFGLLFGTVPSYRILSLDVAAGRAGPVSVARDLGCPLHRPLSGPLVASPVTHRGTVAEFLATLGSEDEAYTWNSFPLPARCRRCGSPVAGAAATCARCGATLRESFSTRLRDADPGRTLADLGVAPAEILPVTSANDDLRGHRLREDPVQRVRVNRDNSDIHRGRKILRAGTKGG